MKRPRYPVVGIAGKARSGKDTVAAFLLAAGVVRYRYSFADPIRAMLAAGLGIDMSEPYWQARKEEIVPAFGKSPRQMMQTLGTEWGRELVDKDLWLTLAKNKLYQQGRGMVVADVRFENESAFVRNMGGIVLHVEREQAAAVNAHASESKLIQDPSDYVIDNSGTLEDLQARLVALFDEG